MPKQKIETIIIGDRYRKDMGDISTLAENIKSIGLLHPIVITPDGKLIAGARRLEACKSLGWTEIPVTVIDIDLLVRGEYSENVTRKDFTPSEMVAIYAAIESYQGQHDVETETDGIPRQQRAAKSLGISHGSLSKAKQVAEAAASDPEKFGECMDIMDLTGNIDAAYKELKRLKLESEKPRIATLKTKEFDTKVVDGSFEEMGFAVPAQALDVIFTYPPVPSPIIVDDYVKTLNALAKFAVEKLRPGGLLALYSVPPLLPECFDIQSSDLLNLWTVCINNTITRRHKILKGHGIAARWQPVVLFCKLPLTAYWSAFNDIITPTDDDNPERSAALTLMEKITTPGMAMCDPFCGDGKFLWAAKRLQLNFIGFDSNSQNVTAARALLSED
jgi:ParB/RepB/Spo0J family partition protein